jgi:hypothetical protein
VALLLRLIGVLFGLPAITNPTICERMKITPRSAQLNIEKLVDRGILQEATGRQRNRVYVATEILGIIERKENQSHRLRSLRPSMRDAGRQFEIAYSQGCRPAQSEENPATL